MIHRWNDSHRIRKTVNGIDAVPAPAVFFLLMAGLLSMLSAAAILHDDFSLPAESHQHWMAVAEGSTPLTFENGHAKLDNNSLIYSAFALHTLSSSPDQFSFSGRITSAALGSGLFCCTDKSTGELKGYAVVVGENELVLLKYDGGNPVELYRHTTGFVDTFENELSLSGDGEHLSVFCNGFFQFSITDTLRKPSDIAVLTPPQSEVDFDDVLFTDLYADTLVFPDMVDSLKKPLGIWSMSGNGTTTATGEGLVVANGKNVTWQAGIPIPVKRFSSSVQFRYDSGSTDNYAGIFIGMRDTVHAGLVTPYLRIGIAFSGKCLVQECTVGGSVNEVAMEEVDLDPDGWNSLELSHADGSMVITVNSHEVIRLEATSQVGYGIGLFVDDSLSMKLSNFKLAYLPEPVSVITVKRPVAGSERKGIHITADLLGRSIPEEMIPSRLLKQRTVLQILVTETGKRIRGL